MKTKTLTAVTLMFMVIAMASGRTEAYSPPVSWLPMSMPSVTYNPSPTNKIAVQSKPSVLLGTNVNPTTSQPGPGIGSFDPAQVWNVLNETAFSRTMGWNDPGYDLVLPPDNSPSSILYAIHNVYGTGSGIWIESTGKSLGLDTYLAVGMWGVNANSTQAVDYANPSGVPYSGIFGTNGSSAKWHWDGYMDHNTYTVPFSYLNMPNQPFSATYRLYIGDAAGNELLVDKNGTPVSSAATTTTWNWVGPAFVFTSQNGAATGTVAVSDVFTASISTSTPWFGSSAISITGGEYSISTDSGATWNAWTSLSGTIANTNKVMVRQTSAVGHGVTTTATLAIPGVPGPGTFRVTTTTVPDPTWPAKIQDGFDQPSLAYAYSIAPDMVEPNHAVIMIKDGILANESSFSADRNTTVTLRGGYDPTFTTPSGVTTIQGASNVLTIKQGRLIVDKVYVRSTSVP